MKEIHKVHKKILIQCFEKAADEIYRSCEVCPVLKYPWQYSVNKDEKFRCADLSEIEYKKRVIRCWQLHWVGDLLPDCAKKIISRR
jgi:hypothetical protein